MDVQAISLYLTPVVKEACATLRLRAYGSDSLVTTDPRVISCSRVAYGMVVTYLNRELVQDNYVERYYEQDTRVRVKTTPIDTVNSIVLIDNPYSDSLTAITESDPLVENTDFWIVRNKLIKINPDAANLSIGDASRIHFELDYVGGYIFSTDDAAIHSALVMQTIAIYNRLPGLGLSSLQGNESTSRGASGQMTVASSPDAGDLLESVQTILSPYVYFGAAESV